MNNSLILLGHGSGGRLSHTLLEEIILPTLTNGTPSGQNDAAILSSHPGTMVFTSDSFVVDPIFFPGGTIGSLAVHGTVNDLAMMGATPRYLSVSLILEEGLPKEHLVSVLSDMRQAADAAGVAIVTGDTKVVPKGKADKIFITTSGIGFVPQGVSIHGGNAQPGDCIILSGTAGDHGIAVMAAREHLATGNLVSDSAPLNGLTELLVTELGDKLHVLRDPTRGGVATTIKEIAQQSQVSLLLREADIPINPAVRGFCSLLGLDPLYVANEGKFLAFVTPSDASRALELLRSHPLGTDAAIIGVVETGTPGQVRLETTVGGMRMLDMLAGEQLPRIC